MPAPIFSNELDAELVPEGLSRSLHREHLEEASFLYEQRRDVLLNDPELSWMDLADSEERWEAHLDALVLGEDLALAVCRQQAEEGDFGELHAAVRVFCRQRRKDLFDEVMETLDRDDEERVRAVADALCDELPQAWEAEILAMLQSEDPVGQSVGARVIGYRRMKVGGSLLQALPQVEEAAVPDVIWALGRLKEPKARTTLYNTYLRHENAAIREAAALALLRLGESAVLRYGLTNARSEPWALWASGLAGTASHRPKLLALMEEQGPSPNGLLALGLLGGVEEVEALLYHLEEPDLAEAAAVGLHLITGAELLEEAFIPEEIDEDELFEDELEAYRQGALPERPDGEPFGTTITRLVQDPEVWRTWWREQQERFQRGLRYRLGEPCTPMSLVNTMQAERLPRSLRQFAYEELVIRYHLDAPFETTMWVTTQQQVLASLAAQVEAHGQAFRPGKWYLAGQLVI